MKKNLLALTVTPLLFAAACTSEDSKVSERPNILFIFTDDWGYGDLGCYGNTEVMTPNIDKLASEGTLFTQFHVASGVSSPSRTAVMTGHYPARYRMHGHLASESINESRGMPNFLDVNIPVLMPRILKESGYATAHYGKWHLGGSPDAPFPIEYGYDDARVWNGNGPTWNGDQKAEVAAPGGNDTLWMQSSNRIAVDATLEFIKENKGKKPIFVNLWLKDPHTPLAPSEEQRAPYKEYDANKETYYAVLTDADFHIGRLMDELKKMGLEENTLVIFSSDNGPAYYEFAATAGSTAGMRGRKATIFQGGVVVPFIMKWPGHVDANKVNNSSVLSSVDLLPTFCDLAGVTLPDTYEPDGESFAEYFETNKFDRSRPLFWDWRIYRVVPPLENWVGISVRDGDWKLVADAKRTRIELFNIPQDPYEKNNLAEQHPDIVEKLMAEWDEWKGGLPPYLEVEKPFHYL